MSTRIPTTPVTKQEARSFLVKARSFLADGSVARMGESWNSAGLLAIHAVISAADALLGSEQGLRSISGDHRDLVRLIRSSAPSSRSEEWNKQADRVSAIISKKNVVEYEARSITEKEALLLFEQAERFCEWVRNNLPRT